MIASVFADAQASNIMSVLCYLPRLRFLGGASLSTCHFSRSQITGV